MSSGLDAIPNINHCQQSVLSYDILNHIVLHSALQEALFHRFYGGRNSTGSIKSACTTGSMNPPLLGWRYSTGE